MVATDLLAPSGSETPARDPRKCTARSKRSGKPCERWSMVGQTTWAMHGGKSKQALSKAAEAVALAELRLRNLAPRAVAELEALVTGADSEQVRLQAANSLRDKSPPSLLRGGGRLNGDERKRRIQA